MLCYVAGEENRGIEAVQLPGPHSKEWDLGSDVLISQSPS